MTLHELLDYQNITIQCHDNPDADAIGAGYGLYCFFKENNKNVRLVYSGRNLIQKSNLRLMIDYLEIPIAYFEPGSAAPLPELLISVDCQYGAGNVSGLKCDDVAIIDHHQVEIFDVEQSLIVPTLGSCSTLVWKMLKDEGFDFEKYPHLGTALYYGLYTDTNQFSEIRNPLDMDMRDEVKVDHSMVTLFRNSNLSLEELEIAGLAMIRYSFNRDYEFAVIKAKQCDPNILGLISDFLLQVDTVKSCLVFNETDDGYKLSVRSCVKEVNASELAAFLTEGIGSGGGHYEKAGGYVSKRLYEESNASLHGEAYFNSRMTQYFKSFDIIHAKDYNADISDMKTYRKKQIPVGYVCSTEVLPAGTPLMIRTMEGDIDLEANDDVYIMIGIKGEVYNISKEKFEKSYRVIDDTYDYEKSVLSSDYVPTIRNKEDGKTYILSTYAHTCITTGEVYIYAKELTRGIKLFTQWNPDRYLLGNAGDFLAVRSDDLKDVYVVDREVFFASYDET